jgi:hypothetical protein
VFSIQISKPSDIRRATVVDSVTASKINTVQQPLGNLGLKTKALPKGFQVENLVPNRVWPSAVKLECSSSIVLWGAWVSAP